MDEALKPLAKLEREAKELHDRDDMAYEADMVEYKARKDALQDDMRKAARGKGDNNRCDIGSIKSSMASLEEPESPDWKRYRTNDATIEKLTDH